MEFDIKPGIVSKNVSSDFSKKIGQIINLYKTPPFGQLTLEECEDLFRQRIEALHVIEMATEINDSNLSVIANSLREIKSYVYKTNCIITKTMDTQQRKLDHFSHMLARMYCIYHPTLWDWFKQNEKRLLYYRLRDQASSLSGAHFESILRNFNFDFQRVLGSELSDLCKENLIGWNKRNNDRETIDIFKVRFTAALQFIAKRSVSLKDGFAFLTRYEILSVVCDVFGRHLDSELQYAHSHLNIEHQQTQQLLDSLHMVYLDHHERMEEEKRRAKLDAQRGETQSIYQMDIEKLGELSKQHFPPCMRYVHEALMEDHHLKHQARLYYGAFLRTGGVDMDSAIEFWRREFTKKIPNDKFERDYKYNIRHLYGREGHKKALSCFSCDKIINDNAPGPTEKHGCPFRHFDDLHLKAMLTKHGLKEVDIESILHQRNEKEYRIACSNYFKYLKGDHPTEPIKNPIHFYYESKRLANRPPPEDGVTEEKETVMEDTFMEE